MKYKYADFIVEVSPHNFKHLNKTSKEYIYEAEKTDVYLEVTLEDVMQETRYSEFKSERPNGFLHATAVQRKFSEWLPLNDAFLFHSACFDVDGEGVAFAAHSGTGKTTHMRLWQEYLGEKMVVVNGDKPIIRFFEDQPNTPYAYGTPWNGKEGYGCNMRTPLKHICFIERSQTNSVEKMDKSQAIDRIFNQVYIPKKPIAVFNTIQLVDRLISCCNIWKINCNMEKEAAKVAYKAIFG